MNLRTWSPFLWGGLWTLVVGSALISRPPLAVDETRYLAVAWEMWRDSQFLVPHLNGEAYSHKPPFLFWMMNLGWAVFGVNEWWPRMVAPIFGLATLFLIARMAWRLWPQEKEIPITAPLILFGCLFWALFTTLTMFDMILAFCAQVGLQGVLRAWRGDALKGFALLGLGIGLGVLTKGPAILLHVMPVALLAPVWSVGRQINWRRWYLGVGAAFVLGLAIALAWAIPAAIAGGEAYANAIFWGQSAGRMVNSFAHGRPLWWYLAVVLPMALPWVIWPTLWRATGRLKESMGDVGVRFCLSWFLPAFAVFSLISGKQLHYLLPIFPALALVIAYLLAKEEKWRGMMLPGLLFMLLGVVLMVLPLVGGFIRLPAWGSLLHIWWGLLPLAGGLAIILVPPKSRQMRVVALAGLTALTVASLHLAARPALKVSYDMKPLALRLSQWESQGYDLAFWGKYHGQFHFQGRLHNPVTPIGLVNNDQENWEKVSGKGKIITFYYKRSKIPTVAKPDMIHKFRRGYFVVWDKQVMLEYKDIARRD